jgi:HJR/Mrr/RecB family endonuclease
MTLVDEKLVLNAWGLVVEKFRTFKVVILVILLSLAYMNQSEFSLVLSFSEILFFFEWTNMKHNRKIQKLSYTLGSRSRRAQRAGILLRKMIIAAIFWPLAEFLSIFMTFSEE